MKILHCYFFLFTLFNGLSTRAATLRDSTSRVKVAVFIPLYIDNVFEGYSYSLGKSNLPKNVLPGLEFYNGVTMAIDSLNSEGTAVEISIYDSKQSGETLQQLFKKAEFNNVGLIIASITSPAELKVFSDEALAKNIPVISATYPNNVGVTANPFFVLLNSSFPAHIEGLYKYMQKYYSANTIIAVTKKGATEDYVKNYITSLNKNVGSIPIKVKWVNVDEYQFTLANLEPMLDSTKSNVLFVASPSESFGLKIVKTISAAEKYRTTAIGMPTWDGIKELDSKSCRNVEVVFSTPFLYYSQNPGLSAWVNQQYKDKYSSRPSDMVFKGFEK